MNTSLQHILFIDIETVPQYPDYQSMPEDWKKLWNLKSSSLLRYHENETEETIYPRAGIYAEFGKIVCIGCGFIQGDGKNRKLILKSFYGDNEQLLLGEFCDMIKKWSQHETRYLCAHNGKEFDFPYLCRRLIANKLPIPGILNISGKKPWEVNHIDTMELWKFGDFKSFTSLNLMAHVLGIPTPKEDLDGSMVWSVYWKEKNLVRIVDYCQKDVLTLVQIYLRIISEDTIDPGNIETR